MLNKVSDTSIKQADSIGSPAGHSGHSGHRRQIRTGTSGHSEIHLTRGKIAKADHADWEWLSQFKWSAQKSGRGGDGVRCGGVPAGGQGIQAAVKGLLANQRESGRWWTRSLNTDRYHFIPYSGTAYPLLALAKCGKLPAQAETSR